MKTLDREDYVRRSRKLSLENKEEQLNQLRNTGSEKRTKSEPEKDRLKKDEDGIVFGQGRTDGSKSNDWPSVLKNCGSKKRLSRRRLSKLADKTRELNAGKTWTDATTV